MPPKPEEMCNDDILIRIGGDIEIDRIELNGTGNAVKQSLPCSLVTVRCSLQSLSGTLTEQSGYDKATASRYPNGKCS